MKISALSEWARLKRRRGRSKIALCRYHEMLSKSSEPPMAKGWNKTDILRVTFPLSVDLCCFSLSPVFWTRTPLASLFLYARCAGEDSKHYLLLCKEDRQAGGCGGGRVKVPQEIPWTGKKMLLSDSNFSETLKHFLLDSDTKTRLSSLGQPVENMCGIFYVTEICFFFFCSPKYLHTYMRVGLTFLRIYL